MLVDTDVLIWHLRGYPQAACRPDSLDALRMSAVSEMKPLQGMRNKAELAALATMQERRTAAILPLIPAITQRATALMETMVLSHGLQMADALVAATGLEHGLTLLAGNVKHLGSIDGLAVERFQP